MLLLLFLLFANQEEEEEKEILGRSLAGGLFPNQFFSCHIPFVFVW